MRIWRNLAICFTLIGVSLTGLFLGCTRQISVLPTIPLNTSPTNTFTPIPPTATLTPTITPTPNGPTATFTITNTPAPPTNTFTITSTPTVTATATPTATNTPDLTLIDDFESTGGAGQDNVANIAAITDQNSVARTGYWGANSDGASVTFTPTTGYVSTTAVELSGSYSTYDQLYFTFLSGGTAYDATVGSTYTGISFYAIANSFPATNCTQVQVVNVDFVDAATSTDHYVAIPLTNTWKQYTVFYNQALSKTGSNVDPTGLSTVKFVPQSNGTTNYDADISLDDIHFTNAAAPAAATPPAANVIDNFQAVMNNTNVTGTAQIQYGAGAGGYWFAYGDGPSPNVPPYSGTEANMCPLGEPGTAFFLSAPGHTGGNSLAAHISGTETAYCGMGFWLGASNTFSNDISSYTKVAFYVRSATSTSYQFAITDEENWNGGGSCYPPNQLASALSASAAWTPVTITFSAMTTAATYSGGSCGGAPAHPVDTTQVGQMQWQPQGAGNFDLWVDDITLIP